MWTIFVFTIILKLTDAFNSNARLSTQNSNHNSIYHSIYHHNLNNKNKTNHQLNHLVNQPSYSLNSQTNQLLNQQQLNTQLSTQSDLKETEQRLYLGQAHIQFTIDLLGNILMNEAYNLNNHQIKSFNFSPFSIQTLLMLMHLASNGNTRSQIESALYLENLFNSNLDQTSNSNYFDNRNDNQTNNIPTIHKIYSQLINNLLTDKQITNLESLSLANKLFYKKDLRINSYFEQMVNYFYNKPLKSIDFTNQRETLFTINNFINKETKGLIKNFINTPPTTTSSFVAANAIHFKAPWKYRFDSQDTENDAIFYKTNGKKESVSMMIGNLPVAHAHSKQLKCSIIELPYKISRLSMFFILPDEINGILNLVRSLNASSLTDLIASMRKTNKNGVNVRIPKFEIDSQFNLNQVLSSLGIRSLFNSNECDLSNMVTTNLNLKDKLTQGLKQNNHQLNTIVNQVNPTIMNSMFNEQQQQQLHINEFSHKSILKIDEDGSLGASASATIVERVGLFNGVYFEADHPFIYFLTDKQSGIILFAGIFANPNK